MTPREKFVDDLRRRLAEQHVPASATDKWLDNLLTDDKAWADIVLAAAAHLNLPETS